MFFSYFQPMKKIILLLLSLMPALVFAQNGDIDLTASGLSASLSNPSNYEYSIDKDDDPMSSAVYKIRMEGERLSVNVLDKSKMTNQKLLGLMSTALKNANNAKTQVKILSKTANMIMIERTTVATGKKIYKFIYTTTQKGKDIMIESGDMEDRELCNRFLEMAKSFKMK